MTPENSKRTAWRAVTDVTQSAAASAAAARKLEKQRIKEQSDAVLARHTEHLLDEALVEIPADVPDEDEEVVIVEVEVPPA